MRYNGCKGMMNGSRKSGQAAIEFLVTYGWAILGVMIVIGALAYFGLFNTQKYVNDACYFGDQFRCEDSILHKDGRTSVMLRNNFGVDINITTVIIKSDYGARYCNMAQTIPIGSLGEINCTVSNTTLSLNNKVKYRAIIEFARVGSSNRHNQTGDLLLTVQS